MIEINTLVAFLGWCTLINISVFAFSAVTLITVKNSVASLHSKLFSVDEDAIKMNYFQYLGLYKIAIIMFNLVPYLALRIIT